MHFPIVYVCLSGEREAEHDGNNSRENGAPGPQEGFGGGRMSPPADVDSLFSIKIDPLPSHIDDDMLRQTFGKYGQVRDVYIPKVHGTSLAKVKTHTQSRTHTKEREREQVRQTQGEMGLFQAHTHSVCLSACVCVCVCVCLFFFRVLPLCVTAAGMRWSASSPRRRVTAASCGLRDWGTCRWSGPSPERLGTTETGMYVCKQPASQRNGWWWLSGCLADSRGYDRDSRGANGYRK